MFKAKGALGCMGGLNTIPDAFRDNAEHQEFQELCMGKTSALVSIMATSAVLTNSVDTCPIPENTAKYLGMSTGQ